MVTGTQDDSDEGHPQATICFGGGIGKCLINDEGQSAGRRGLSVLMVIGRLGKDPDCRES
jgi:hypothetical protein